MYEKAKYSKNHKEKRLVNIQMLRTIIKIHIVTIQTKQIKKMTLKIQMENIDLK